MKVYLLIFVSFVTMNIAVAAPVSNAGSASIETLTEQLDD